MKMKSLLYICSIALISLALHSCSFNSVRGNGTIVTQEVNITDYSEFKFSGGSTLVYEQKPDTAPYLRIEVDENIFPLLEIKSENGVLSIGSKENISPTKYTIYTNSTNLSKLGISGSLDAHLKGSIQTTDLSISSSGSSSIIVDNITCNSLKTDVSGSGDITLAGKANKLSSYISGSGKVKASELIADTVSCNVSGSGDFFVHANKLLDVHVSGSGSVQYKGEPQITQSISGSGSVSAMK
ncbi:head GIN domain-containing protein [Dysgonomonas sp. ZJ709]|uniref:head GIN domain-containing protein n=1 Tax=Dysgonomonas sp. ZJ709 TaxID=2709797 RepID=UPI0021055E7F|nr:head GIN domain-containing protein [Dysgonomonas sp. ZJ709]